jgi:hypothetical protein
MRNILLAIILAALPVSVVAAEPLAPRKPDQPAPAKLLPLKGAGTANACAAFGPGFVAVEGTSTCVKIGGSVSIGGGGSVGRR